jgi:hypothetical protein
VHGSLVLITLGGNDFVNNYYLVPYSARSREFSLPDYINYILSEYRQILTVTHALHCAPPVHTPLHCLTTYELTAMADLMMMA